MNLSDIISAIGSPALSGALVWVLLQAHFKKEAELLAKVADVMNDLKTRMAVHESRAALVDDMRKDIASIRDELTKTRSSLEAAWRYIDSKEK